MTITKTEGWEERLAEFVASRSATPFAWGSHDCCAFTAGAVHAMTGADAMAAHRSYSTSISAARVIREAGGIMAIPPALGLLERRRVICASRGDVMAAETYGGRKGRKVIALGICIGALSAFAGPVGATTLKTSECLKAWRVE